MQDLAAFTLRADLQGDVEIESDDGPQTVPAYQGGLLNIGDGDFDVAEHLAAGDGTIVARASDSLLVEMLEAYPALVRTAAPDSPAHVVSPYERRSLEDLRHVRALRDLSGAGSSRESIVEQLEAHDAALAQGSRPLAELVRAGNSAAIAEALGGKPADGLDGLKTDDLEQLAKANDVALEGASNNAERVELLRAAGVRKD